MTTPFTIEQHTTIDKRFEIYGPDITILVDYDDVDHATVDERAKNIVDILNSHWPRAKTVTAPIPTDDSEFPFLRSCNRHTDCAKADTEAKAKGAFGASHCHDECCEDCFGC